MLLNMSEEAASPGLPEPEFREDHFRFVTNFRSFAAREGGVRMSDPFRVLLEQGGISDRQYRGLLHPREHGATSDRDCALLMEVSERTALNDPADLVRKGLIEPAGGSGGSGWQTTYRLPEDAG